MNKSERGPSGRGDEAAKEEDEMNTGGSRNGKWMKLGFKGHWEKGCEEARRQESKDPYERKPEKRRSERK